MRTIATFTTPEEAHLLRTRLEFGGVPAYVQDENVVQLDWFFSNAIGGVRVQVADANLGEALRFLSTDVPPPLENVCEVTCPSCGSTDTMADESWRPRVLFFWLFLKLPTPFTRHRWLCRTCGHPFKVAPLRPALPPPLP